MSWRLHFYDWLFTRETKAFEFWAGLFALTIGGSFSGGQSALKLLSTFTGEVFFFNLETLGFLLIFGSVTQLVGLTMNVLGKTTGRILRWLGSVVEGAVWGTCFAYSIAFMGVAAAELRWVYALLFLQEAWVVMAIAYRGFRGKDPH